MGAMGKKVPSIGRDERKRVAVEKKGAYGKGKGSEKGESSIKQSTNAASKKEEARGHLKKGGGSAK